jgi:hypothetical protein
MANGKTRTRNSQQRDAELKVLRQWLNETIGKQPAGLPTWGTSSPTKNPTHVVRADYNDNRIVLTFGHVFAAKKMVDILVADEEYKWTKNKLNDQTSHRSRPNAGL